MYLLKMDQMKVPLVLIKHFQNSLQQFQQKQEFSHSQKMDTGI